MLPIQKKWFDMIVSGKKKEEYREIKPYYDSRLYRFIPSKFNNYVAPTIKIIFRNGYSFNSPSVKCKCTVDIGTGKKEWGATPGQRYYVLKILQILEVK